MIYPGLPDHPRHHLAEAVLGGGGTMIALDLDGGKEAAFKVLDALRIWSISNNLGDARSIVTHPATTTHQRLSEADRARLVARLAAFPLPIAGSEGYRTAEVTGGGVALAEVHAATLESRRTPGLFFCGEVLDAFGPIGGYNFLWAWTTGRLAGLGAAQSSYGSASGATPT